MNYKGVEKFGWYALLEGSDRQGNADTWFVDGNHGSAANSTATGQGASWNLPFANINYAISRCSNGASNIIFVAAGHTETIADTNDNNVSGTTTDEFCVDKSGVTIIGLGDGDRRPKITLATATDACIDVRAANCVLYNLWFQSNLAAIVAMLDAQAAADGLVIDNCRFDMASNAVDPILMINLTADCDDVTIKNCRFYAAAANDATLAAIKLEGGSDRIRIVDNHFYGDWNEQVIDADTALSTEVEITGNVFNNIDAGVSNAIDLHASTTGVVMDNTVYCPASGSGGAAIVAAGCLKANNRYTSVLANEAGDATVDTSGLHKKYYVDSGTGADTNDGTSWETAVATIGAAIDLCTASNGDEIHVAAGHAQNLTGAGTTTEFDMDCIGVSVIGHGVGDNRPVFTFITDATNACVDVTTADCKLENLVFACNIASQKYMVYANTSADGLEIRNCEFREGGQTPLSAVLLGGGDGQADGVIIDNCRFYLPTAGNQDNAIEILYDMAGVEITNNYIMGNFDEAAIEIPVGGNACQDLIIKNNIIINEQTGIHCIEVEQTALTVTGVCANNILVNDTRGAALRPNILNCYGNIWMPLGGNARPVVLEGELTTPGQNYYVDSGHAEAVDDTAHGTSWDFPLATIEYVNTNLAVANNNDVIHVAPGHEETISDSVFLDFDIAGVTVVGYGNGEDRPTITFDHANAVVDIGASNVTLRNLIFRPSVDGVAVGVDILDTFDGTTIEDCVFGYPEAATDEFAIALQIGNAGDHTTIRRCRFEMGGNASVNVINMTQANAYLTIEDCVFTGACSGPHIKGTAAATTNSLIKNNHFLCTGNQDTFNLIAASTGLICDNRIVMTAASVAAAMDVGNCWCMNNWFIADDDVTGAKGGILDTTAASVTASADD